MPQCKCLRSIYAVDDATFRAWASHMATFQVFDVLVQKCIDFFEISACGPATIQPQLTPCQAEGLATLPARGPATAFAQKIFYSAEFCSQRELT
jgi:hypothetical protein